MHVAPNVYLMFFRSSLSFMIYRWHFSGLQGHLLLEVSLMITALCVLSVYCKVWSKVILLANYGWHRQNGVLIIIPKIMAIVLG